MHHLVQLEADGELALAVQHELSTGRLRKTLRQAYNETMPYGLPGYLRPVSNVSTGINKIKADPELRVEDGGKKSNQLLSFKLEMPGSPCASFIVSIAWQVLSRSWIIVWMSVGIGLLFIGIYSLVGVC